MTPENKDATEVKTYEVSNKVIEESRNTPTRIEVKTPEIDTKTLRK